MARSALAQAAREHGRRRQCRGAAGAQRGQPARLWPDGGGPAFELVRERVLSIEGGPLASLAVATHVLAALTGSASGGLTIALQALGGTYLRLSAAIGSAFGSFRGVSAPGAVQVAAARA